MTPQIRKIVVRSCGLLLVIAASWTYLRGSNPETLGDAEEEVSQEAGSQAAPTEGAPRVFAPVAENVTEAPLQSPRLKRMTPDEEVRSWGKPLMEGEVALPESRRAYHAIYRTSMKYPLMLVQQLWRVSPLDPLQKEYLGERKMIADHLLVRLHETADAAAFEQKLGGQGMELRKKMYTEGLYLVSFPLEGVDTLQRMQAILSQMPEVSSANPDIFSRGF